MLFKNVRMISSEMKIRVLNGTKNYTEKKKKLSLLKIFFSRITTINRWLIEHGYDVAKLWADIDDVVIKTLISAHSVLKHNYRACFPNHYRGSGCFEILGFDVLLDRNLKPHVLEVRSLIDISYKN